MSAAAHPPLQASRVRGAAQRVLVALWVGVVPALLAALVIRYLVPATGAGLRGVVSHVLGHRFALYGWAALFLLFSALTRYWRRYLPGGRYVSVLPADVVPEEKDPRRLAEWADAATLYETLRSQGSGRRRARSLDRESMAVIDDRLRELRAALQAGDWPRARDARGALETAAAPALAWRRRRSVVAMVATIGAVGIAALAFRARVAEPYHVLGPSMLPTLEPDDFVAGVKVGYAGTPGRLPSRSDVVVFRSSAIATTLGSGPLPHVLVKRVVGLPGDRISVRGNVPIINGWRVPSCSAGEYAYVIPDASGGLLHGRLVVEFLGDRSYLTVHAAGAPALDEYVVKPGEVFVLGDNRGNSTDSRAFDHGHGGGVPLGAIEARAQWFLTGSHGDGDTDWSRMLHPIDTMQARLRLEGMDTRALEEGISSCLSQRPSTTQPPPPSQVASAAPEARP